MSLTVTLNLPPDVEEKLRQETFDLIRDLMIETGVLDRKIQFEEYVDTRFAEGARSQIAWPYKPVGAH